jgi:hypothetical protein
MFDLVLEWWKWAEIPVQIIESEQWETFEFERRFEAENRSSTPIYVLSDDDCLPLASPNQTGVEWLAGAVETVERWRAFGCLSAFHDNEPASRWDNEQAIYNDEVMEHINVGGCRFIWKGLTKTGWREFNGRDYDCSHAGMLAEQGYKVGYLRNYRTTHLGKYQSEIWNPEKWGSEPWKLVGTKFVSEKVLK